MAMVTASAPLVSVIIPAYNAQDYIDESVQSALAQSYESVEIIVVDDGSSDSTGRRVAAYGSRVEYLYTPNSGGFPGAPRNIGMARARGEYLCFLDADDIMLPHRIQAQAEFLRLHPDVGCVFGDYRNFTANDTHGPSHFTTCPRLSALLSDKVDVVVGCADATALLLHENVGLPSSMAINRRVLDRVPGFPTDIRIGEDFHFAYRIASHWPLGVINSLVSLRRLHESNVTRDELRMLLDYVRSYSRLRSVEQRRENAALLASLLHQCEVGLARLHANRGQYGIAMSHGLRALLRSSPRHPREFATGLRSIMRTMAIAARVKRPAP